MAFAQYNRLKQIEVLEDAIKFLQAEPGTTSKYFSTFSTVRNMFEVSFRDRADLLAYVRHLHKTVSEI